MFNDIGIGVSAHLVKKEIAKRIQCIIMIMIATGQGTTEKNKKIKDNKTIIKSNYQFHQWRINRIEASIVYHDKVADSTTTRQASRKGRIETNKKQTNTQKEKKKICKKKVACI